MNAVDRLRSYLAGWDEAELALLRILDDDVPAEHLPAVVRSMRQRREQQMSQRVSHLS